MPNYCTKCNKGAPDFDVSDDCGKGNHNFQLQTSSSSSSSSSSSYQSPDVLSEIKKLGVEISQIKTRQLESSPTSVLEYYESLEVAESISFYPSPSSLSSDVFSSIPPPPANALESAVQEWFAARFDQLKLTKTSSSSSAASPMTSRSMTSSLSSPYFYDIRARSPNAHCVGRRKFDLDIYIKGKPAIPFNCAMVGELKKRQSNDHFADGHIAQVASFLAHLLRAQPFRSSCPGFLSDGRVIQFFQMRRHSPVFSLVKSPSMFVNGEGGRVLLAYMLTPPEERHIDWCVPIVKLLDNVVSIDALLGTGGAATVYKGSFGGSSVVVKHFGLYFSPSSTSPSPSPKLVREMAMLNRLASHRDLDGLVPVLLGVDDISGSLILQPVGIHFSGDKKDLMRVFTKGSSHSSTTTTTMTTTTTITTTTTMTTTTTINNSLEGEGKTDTNTDVDAHFVDGVEKVYPCVTHLIELIRILRLLHGHGIVHRDVKPTNFFATKGGRKVLLNDFGSAAYINARCSPSTPTYSSFDILSAIADCPSSSLPVIRAQPCHDLFAVVICAFEFVESFLFKCIRDFAPHARDRIRLYNEWLMQRQPWRECVEAANNTDYDLLVTKIKRVMMQYMPTPPTV